MNKIVTIGVILAGALISAQGQAPGTGDHRSTVTFHVNSVTSGEAPRPWCDSGKCIATLITVKGFIAQPSKGRSTRYVQYVLTCIDVVGIDPPSHTLNCPRVHAESNYDVELYASTIAFIAEHPSDESWVNYDIVSEQATSNSNP